VKKGVEHDLEENLSDEFDDVFGLDADKKKARDKIKALLAEEKLKAKKKGSESAEVESDEASVFEKVDSEGEEVDDLGDESKEVDAKSDEEDEFKEDEDDDEVEGEEDETEEPEEEEPVKKKPVKKQKREKLEPVDVLEPEEIEGEPEKDIEEVLRERAERAKKKLSEPKVEIVEPVEESVKPELAFLQDGDSSVLIGRKKVVYEKYGLEAALLVGRVRESAFSEREVFLDSLNPHVVFVCGARGSGKSYALGVIAEELAMKNPNVGIVVIDPVGVFWSMKFPNREEKELESLKKWGLSPKGLDNMMVFIPKGMEKSTPRETYDATFSIRPSLLTATDWCLTFGLEKFSPTGLLLEQAIEKLKTGFITTEKEKIRGKGDIYDIDDILFCIENDSVLNSREKGYKADSVRALVSRFAAAKAWGIFDSTGTPLSELSRENQLTIIDTSFLDDSVTALVIGILSRRILAARKISTRKEAAKRMEVEKDADLLEFEIPPTWLFIDEAHTLIPSGNISTPATAALIEYVKQGRRPGCSLVFATQQPSAINSKVLSQLDIIMTHKLVFNDDVKAVYKRTPTIIPHKYKASAFIKTLPVGTALVGDRREETSRAFLMRIRPRMSQHEGREAETIGVRKKLSDASVKKLLSGLYWNRLKRDHSFKTKELARIVTSMNHKYESNVSLEEILAILKAKGAILDENAGVMMLNPVEKHESVEKSLMRHGEKSAAGENEEDEEDEDLEDDELDEDDEEGEVESEDLMDTDESPSLLAFPLKISEANAKKTIRKKKLGRLFGLLNKGQYLTETRLKHIPVFRVQFNYFNEKDSFREGTLFISSLTGEFLHYKKGKFMESNGLKDLYDLKEDEITILNLLSAPKDLKTLSKKIYFDESKITRILKKLCERELVKSVKKKNAVFFELKKQFDLPPTPLHPLHRSIQKMPLVEAEVLMKESERYTKKDVTELLKKIWKKLVVKNVDEIYWPVFEGTIESDRDEKRRVLVDAVTGKILAN